MYETVSVDDVLESALADVVKIVGAETYLAAPLVTLDERCFPDAWEPTLAGVRTALRRFMRHVGLPDVPVVVTDERPREEQRGPVVDPIAFSGIEDGRACFSVFAINDPKHMAAWLALEVVRAWAEHRGVTRSEPLAYRAIPLEDLPPQPEGALDASSATVTGIALGLGPVLAAGSVQAHKNEEIGGAWVSTQWSRAVVGGFPPPVLARLLAMHAVTRDADDDERATVRACLPEDVVPDFDEALAEMAADAVILRAHMGLPKAIDTTRRPIDDAPLPEEDDTPLRAAERDHRERVRHFNRDRRVYRIAHDHTLAGGSLAAVAGGILGSTAGMGWPIVAGLVIGGLAGALVGKRRRFYRCSDPDCAGRPTEHDTKCPGCGGVIAGELAHARDRLAADEEA